MVSTLFEDTGLSFTDFEKDWEDLITLQSSRFLGAMKNFENEIVRLLDIRVSPIVIKLALFYQWARLISWTHNLDNIQQEEWLLEIEKLMLPIAKLMRDMARTLSAQKINDDTHSLSPKLTKRLENFDPLTDEGLSKDNIDKQFYIANQSFFKVVEHCFQTKLSEKTLSSVCLFFWFKCFSSVTDIAERDTLKIEHHWGRVMESVSCLIER